MKRLLLCVSILVLATSVFGLEKKAYQMREDSGMAPEYDGALQYYYYIPCPTYSWFWIFRGWSTGDIIGMSFPIGDRGTGGWDPLDPLDCMRVEQVRVLDFWGNGVYYPGLFTVEFDLWCWDPHSANHHFHLWNSGPWETEFGWNYIPVEPSVELCYSCEWGGEYGDHDGPVVVVTATMTGTDCYYPAWGMDNISTAIESGCQLHDIDCLPAVYPRDWAGGSGERVHSGFFGSSHIDFQYFPPAGFVDGRDTTPDGSQFGFLELAWTIYVGCDGPSSSEQTTWGRLKSMYR